MLASSSGMENGIAEALGRLQAIEKASDQPPAMIVLPPDSGKFIIGNSGGFVHLAIAALRAAQGETQPFKDAQWVGEIDLDWAVSGLEYDPDAHIYLPPTPTTPTIGLKVARFLVPVFGIICLFVGLAVVAQWGFHMLGKLK